MQGRDSTVVISPENGILLPCYHFKDEAVPIDDNLYELYTTTRPVQKAKARKGVTVLQGLHGLLLHAQLALPPLPDGERAPRRPLRPRARAAAAHVAVHRAASAEVVVPLPPLGILHRGVRRVDPYRSFLMGMPACRKW